MKTLVFILLFLCPIFSGQIHAQTDSQINKGSIMDSIHAKHLGEIAFMQDFIPYDEFEEVNFLDEILLSNSSSFNIRLFLANTLTYYLSQMAINSSLDDLCSNGNFQFTFTVDGTIVSTIKLPPGAGSCDYKNSQMVYGVPFVNERIKDHWGVFTWQKFLYRDGGNDKLTPGKHRLEIRVQPYLKIDKQELIGKEIARGSVSLIVTPPEVSEKQVAIQKIKSKDFPISAFPYKRDHIKELNKKIAQEEFKEITSILVAKEGELLIEEYFNGANRKTLHDTRSLSKSFTSTLMGIAIKEGYITGVKATLDGFYSLENYQNFEVSKASISIHQLLSHSSGLYGDDTDLNSPGNEEQMYPSTNWVDFVLDLPYKKEWANNWHYFTGGVIILGDILNRSVPEGLEKYADNALFGALGIKKYKWQYTPQGLPNTAGSCQLTSIDYLKYGQLYLNEGRWNAQQIITKDWVRQSFQEHVQRTDSSEGYGYLFWKRKYQYGDNNISAFTASGNGGNHLVIIPELRIVILITATAYNQAYAHVQAEEIIVNYLLPAIFTQN